VIIQITDKLKDNGSFADVLGLVKHIAGIADNKNASYIKIMDMSARLIITDYFLVVSARNQRATRAIENEIAFQLKKIGILPISVSGSSEGNWILMDYDDFIIHIFTDEYRKYYDLERLWKDSKAIDYAPEDKGEPGKE